MNGFLSNLGYVLLKLIVTIMVGGGVTVIVMGLFVANDPNWFRRPEPPGGVYVAAGIGFVTMAGLLGYFFLTPRSPRLRPATVQAAKDEWPDEGSSPTEKIDGAFQSRGPK